jgi:hypothetical protein
MSLKLAGPSGILVWKVTGRRDLSGGGTRELISTVFGSDEAAARRNFDRLQARTEALRGDPPQTIWRASELTFTPVPQQK